MGFFGKTGVVREKGNGLSALSAAIIQLNNKTQKFLSLRNLCVEGSNESNKSVEEVWKE
jgi:hypothetical protein